MKKLILGFTALLTLSSGAFASTYVCKDIMIDDEKAGFITKPGTFKITIETVERIDDDIKKSDHILYEIRQGDSSLIRKAYANNSLAKSQNQGSLKRLDEMFVRFTDQIGDVKMTFELDAYDLTLYQKISTKDGQFEKLELRCSEEVLLRLDKKKNYKMVL